MLSGFHLLLKLLESSTPTLVTRDIMGFVLGEHRFAFITDLQLKIGLTLH